MSDRVGCNESYERRILELVFEIDLFTTLLLRAQLCSPLSRLLLSLSIPLLSLLQLNNCLATTIRKSSIAYHSRYLTR